MQRIMDANEFMAVARMALKSGDPELLSRAVGYRWHTRQVSSLLKHHDPQVRQVAAITLGLIGDITQIPCLTRALKDKDYLVNQMAEHSLWTIWLRAGKPAALQVFKLGMALLAEENYHQAIVQFMKAAQIDPFYAETYNQAGIACYFLNDWNQALKNWRRTIELIPTHFGAAAGMGHCCTHLKRPKAAVRYYRYALRINPRMTAVANAIQKLKSHINDVNDQSGEFLSYQHFT